MQHENIRVNKTNKNIVNSIYKNSDMCFHIAVKEEDKHGIHCKFFNRVFNRIHNNLYSH